ncbi:MAG: hypothetical protein WCA22_07610 [Candidatus Binatus sp.]
MPHNDLSPITIPRPALRLSQSITLNEIVPMYRRSASVSITKFFCFSEEPAAASMNFSSALDDTG